MRKSIPFYVITGFLGSGKTTFLKNLIREIQGDKKIGIILNEFAPANVESEEIKQETNEYEILEINNGSVFCLCLLHDFVESLDKFIQDHDPDLLILEASGLSDPIAIAQLFNTGSLNDKVYLAQVWSIVDALNFFRSKKFLGRIAHQIRVADQVIINKTDLIPADTLKDIRQEIIKLNSFAKILNASFCDVVIDFKDVDIPSDIQSEDINTSFQNIKRPPVKSGVFKTVTPLNPEQLNILLEKYIQQTIRIKGHVKLTNGRMVKLQTVYDQVTIKQLKDYIGPTELVILGENFDLHEFNKDYRSLARAAK